MSAVSAKFLKDINETLGGVEKIQGKQGVGIASVKQTTSSEDSGGKNTVTVTLDNGTTSTFDVYNGKKGGQGDPGIQGPQGPQGPIGKTPEISITATTDQTTGTATVEVTKTNSSDETPAFKFDFSGIKGEQGDSLTATFNDDYYLIIKNASTEKEISRHYVRGAQGETGAKGDPFKISRTFKTLALLNSALSAGNLVTGNYYMIATDDTDEEDNGLLYLCEETSAGEQYLTKIADLSGPVGITGVGIASVKQTTTSDEDEGINVVTVTLDDDQKTTSQFQVKNGSKGSKGEPGNKGDTGTSIASISSTSATNANGLTTTKVTVNKDDNTSAGSFTVSDGVGIKSITEDPSNDSGGTNTIKILKTDGKTSEVTVKNGVSVTHKWDGTTLSVTSASGTSSADLKGDPGANGRGIDSIGVSQSTASGGKTPITINYTDSSDPTDLYVLNGKDGKGISNVSVNPSTESGGENIVTMEYTDNTSTKFSVYNGKDADTTSLETIINKLINYINVDNANYNVITKTFTFTTSSSSSGFGYRGASTTTDPRLNYGTPVFTVSNYTELMKAPDVTYSGSSITVVGYTTSPSISCTVTLKYYIKLDTVQ